MEHWASIESQSDGPQHATTLVMLRLSPQPICLLRSILTTEVLQKAGLGRSSHIGAEQQSHQYMQIGLDPTTSMNLGTSTQKISQILTLTHMYSNKSSLNLQCSEPNAIKGPWGWILPPIYGNIGFMASWLELCQATLWTPPGWGP